MRLLPNSNTFVATAIQKVTVVRYQDQRAVKRTERVLQNVLRLDIEVVRRLIQDQQVHRLQQQLDHGQACLLTTDRYFYFLLDRLAAEHKGTQNVA